MVTAIQVTVWDEVRGKTQIILFLKRKVPFIQKKEIDVKKSLHS